jgi:hypothetical protein
MRWQAAALGHGLRFKGVSRPSRAVETAHAAERISLPVRAVVFHPDASSDAEGLAVGVARSLEDETSADTGTG